MRVIVAIPVFNHAGTIGEVVAQVREVISAVPDVVEVVVINDGSWDGTAAILEEMGPLAVLTHGKNRGKGAALLTAFRYAQQRGATHVVTVDADGQHDAGDIPRLIGVTRQHASDVIIGWRDMDAPGMQGVPNSSRKGRDISRYWLRVQTGQDIPDSQCGLRVYPIPAVLRPSYRFQRFDFETEVLARAAWGGMRIRSVPVRCIYFDKGRRVSHFRPLVDTLRGIWVNVFLVGRRLIPAPFPRLVGRAEEAPRFRRWWSASGWRGAIREAMRAGSSNAELATAFALGIFVGLTPFYFLQTILAIYLARRLHLNVLAAVLGSQISIPPLAPLWFVLSYGTGNLLLHGRWGNIAADAFSGEKLPALAIGSAMTALAVSSIALLLARQVLGRIRPNPVST